MSYSVSFLVPALNEQKNLRAAIDNIYEANKEFNYRINILIVNDGSEDTTGEIADELARNNEDIMVYHNRFIRGLGAAYTVGMILCNGDYYGYMPADNQIPKEYIAALFKRMGEADLILSFPENMDVRHKHRQIISRSFTWIYNFVFRMNINYYNGPAFFRLELLRELDFPTRFWSYHAETVLRFIKHGYSYIEVPCKLNERQHGKSTALKWFNFIGIFLGTLFVFVDVYIVKRVDRNLKKMQNEHD
ncbi:MAG: glycosyltransferase family 2 protein [Colwellia sp.]|nr:glycosyltransferase family 2 protein [Colwellia sp.]